MEIIGRLFVRRFVYLFGIIFVITSLSPLQWTWANEIKKESLTQLANQLGFWKYQGSASANSSIQKPIKIAILDNGFFGYDDAIGKSLPASTQYHEGPIKAQQASMETHGLAMAQVVSGLLESILPKDLYQIHLFSSYGYTNLKSAIENVVQNHFDIVLYSIVWDYGGNGDGNGFINALVSKATDAGILWINASGNTAKSTWTSKIENSGDGWVRLPGPHQSVQIRCPESKDNSDCPLRIVLSWNDFSDSTEVGTDKDLDLYLTDENLNVLKSSTLKQNKFSSKPNENLSLYPREIIEYVVQPGLYYARVKMKSNNFDSEKDVLRIVTPGIHSFQVDTTFTETLMPPADHPQVITVGAIDSEHSSRSSQRLKPEVYFPSRVTMEDSEFEIRGSSTAAAVAAAASLVLRYRLPAIDRKNLIEGLKVFSQGPSAVDRVTTALHRPLPTKKDKFGRPCYSLARLPSEFFPNADSFFQLLNRSTGIWTVESNQGLLILTSIDPFAHPLSPQKTLESDRLYLTPRGLIKRSHEDARGAPPGRNTTVEVLQMAPNEVICPLF